MHDFQKSLARSQNHAEAEWWADACQKAFPTFQSMNLIRGDGWAQRGGCDRILILSSGKTLYVDEKYRETVYPDVLLEYWSSEEHRRPGWIAKDLACDYIAYAWMPSQRCLMLPFHLLRQVWHENRLKWVKAYPIKRAFNKGYTTVSVAVPIEVLLDAMKGAITVSFDVAVRT